MRDIATIQVNVRYSVRYYTTHPLPCNSLWWSADVRMLQRVKCGGEIRIFSADLTNKMRSCGCKKTGRQTTS